MPRALEEARSRERLQYWQTPGYSRLSVMAVGGTGASPYAGAYFMALALNKAELPAAGRAEHSPAFADVE